MPPRAGLLTVLSLYPADDERQIFHVSLPLSDSRKPNPAVSCKLHFRCGTDFLSVERHEVQASVRTDTPAHALLSAWRWQRAEGRRRRT
jgi:hypothetical protein